MPRRRLLIALTTVAAALGVPATGYAYVTAMSDQQAGMFADPLFQALNINRVRYIAAYDTATKADFQRAEADVFLNAARNSGARVLVSFGHSRRPGRGRRLPSVKEFTSAFKKFKARYPFVKEYSPWNEANHKSQPTWKSPKRVADYFLAVKRNCRGCTIVALDVIDEVNFRPTLSFIRKFKRYARRGKPRILGLHNYSDTNRFRRTATRAVLKEWRGDVWLTETGGVVKFGSNFPYDEQRAARALSYMFRLAASNRRIKRLYIYQWTGAPPGSRFDAGLVDFNGAPRPGYFVVRKKLTGV
jgi:hypothetical protein